MKLPDELIEKIPHMVDAIDYSIAKQVPDMGYGFVIQTNYGDMVILPEDAWPFMQAANKMLERRKRNLLKCLKSAGAK